jgi:hypothetical protein
VVEGGSGSGSSYGHGSATSTDDFVPHSRYPPTPIAQTYPASSFNPTSATVTPTTAVGSAAIPAAAPTAAPTAPTLTVPKPRVSSGAGGWGDARTKAAAESVAQRRHCAYGTTLSVDAPVWRPTRRE